MNPASEDNEPPSKRRKLKTDVATNAGTTPPLRHPEDSGARETVALSLKRSISPPALRKTKSRAPLPSNLQLEANTHVTDQALAPKEKERNEIERGMNTGGIKSRKTASVRSPIQLTRIRDLGSEQNVDTVSLNEILGDPMIKECWNFNYLFDLDFVMGQLDADVKEIVKMKIVHGFWKNEDANRIALLQGAERYSNVQLISAYMPDPFGTHHSKMLVLIRHDDTAQIVIHTANMIPRDWGNMTQAVWRSPILPSIPTPSSKQNGNHPIGSGQRFKTDLLNYLHAYGKRLLTLITELQAYDFTPIRAAFLGSAPSRQKPSSITIPSRTSFGWLGLKEILSTIPVPSHPSSTTPPNLVIQVSSIATLGADPTWINHFHSILSTTASSSPSPVSNSASSSSTTTTTAPPRLNIIFPTAAEIRTSLDGYASGASIHTKLQSPAQQKQLQYLHPLLRHWKHMSPSSSFPSATMPSSQSLESAKPKKAHRGPAAPHIKTYIRFRDQTYTHIDWALLTSANLSRQAWGERENKNGEVRVQSYEVGVCVWPGLFAEEGETEGDVDMVPVFGRDDVEPEDGGGEMGGERRVKAVVGWRMPYDVPLQAYGAEERPWCATMADEEQDWMGRVWRGY